MRTFIFLLKSVRTHQWIKNDFILLPLLFSKKVFDFPSLLLDLQSLVIFCAMSGAVYLINDLVQSFFKNMEQGINIIAVTAFLSISAGVSLESESKFSL
jgi:hypothetical protein